MNALPRILVVHNRYRWPGGEDIVAEAEVALLRAHGHEVETYSRNNDVIGAMPRMAVAQETLWSSRTTDDLSDRIVSFRPDVVHVHNTFPLVSPSLFWAAARKRLPVVQTLHNFRLLCPQAMFLRQNHVCEDCLGAAPWRGVLRRCYHDSAAESAVLAGMLMLHRALGTYRHKVTRYIALNRFCQDKFIEGGLPAERISIKPNFVDIPQTATGERSGGLFVGRLAQEKGIDLLLAALDRLPGTVIDIVGGGPEMERMRRHPGIRHAGMLTHDGVLARMQRAAYLVMPSIWYETFALVVVEAFACGLPVIASRLGAMQELIDDGRTGLLFDPGSADDLARKIRWAQQNPEAMQLMGYHARGEYATKYTPASNYEQLLAIYRQAIEDKNRLLH
jgi:glycosyltransferase involved in cell wall biosynthesis